MAKLNTPLTFTGALGDLSAYTMRGVDSIILRRKGGASKDKIKKSPAFALTRLNNAEFSGRARGSKYLMRALQFIKPLADYNIAGPLNAILKPVQEADHSSELGKRSVFLSRMPHVIDGFSLNQKTRLETVLRCSLQVKVNKETGHVSVNLPELIPGINLVIPAYRQYFQILLSVGLVPDLILGDAGYMPVVEGSDGYIPVLQTTPWFPANGTVSPSQLEITLESPMIEHATLVVALGICFGDLQPDGRMAQVRHAGHARIIAAV